MTTYFLHNDAREQNLKFYGGYDPFFISSEAKLLLVVSETWDDFLRYGKDHDAEFGSDPSKTRAGLRARIRFAEYQQFEASFALMLAPFQPLPHWLYLTTYRTSDLLKFAEAFAEGDVGALTEARLDAMGTFLGTAIYGGRPPLDPTAEGKWSENLAVIEWMLRLAAQRYVKAASFGGEYNAYKHGLRVLTGSSEIRVAATDDGSDSTMLANSNDSLMFLELEPHGDGQKRVVEVLRHFNPVESFQFIKFMSALSENMQNARLATLNATAEVRFHYFHDLDQHALRKMSNVFEIRLG